MSHTRQLLARATVLFVLLMFAVSLVAAIRSNGPGKKEGDEANAPEQWEYLAVAGPSTTNLTPTNNPRMRKEPNVPFGREAFVLEQHLDKLGANGWELIAVAGSPTDPAYYFKRRK